MRLILLILLCCLPVFEAYALKTLVIINNGSSDISPLRLMASSPYDRQVMDTPPQLVSFSFSQPIKPDKSVIRVYDPLGNPVETGELQAQGMTLSVTLPPLTTGKYAIKWRARCLCDEENEIGDTFHFTVR